MTGYQRALDEIGHHSHDEHGQRLTVDRIAERMGVQAHRLRKTLSAYDDAHPLNAAYVVALTHATRNLSLIRYFAEACGCVLVPLPQVRPGHIDVITHAGSTAREFSDVLAEAGRALADGRVTRDEALTFRRQTDEAITALATFALLMERKAGIAPPADIAVTVGGVQ